MSIYDNLSSYNKQGNSERVVDVLDVATLKIDSVEVTATAAQLNTVASGNLVLSRAALAAAGTTSADAGAIASQVVAVTASDGTKGVVLPAAATTAYPVLVINTVLTTGATLKVYPVDGGNDQINGGAEDAAFVMGPGKAAWFVPTSATQWYVEDASANTSTTTELNTLTGITATATELNSWCDQSAGLQAVTGAAAITADGTITKASIDSGGAYAITLAVPGAAAVGKLLCIEYSQGATDAVTLALTNVVGGTAATTASFNADGEGLLLYGAESKWVVIKEFGGVTLS